MAMSGSEEGSGDEESGHGPIRSGNLEDHLKKQTSEMKGGEGMWKGDGSMDLMEERLIEIAEHVWEDAARRTDRDGRKTVQPDEIRDSFEDLLVAKNLLLEASTTMKTLRWEFMDVAEQSPAIEFDEDQERENE